VGFDVLGGSHRRITDCITVMELRMNRWRAHSLTLLKKSHGFGKDFFSNGNSCVPCRHLRALKDKRSLPGHSHHLE